MSERRQQAEAGVHRADPRTKPIGVSSQNAAQGPKAAWGDEVGPRAAADSTLKLRFAGLCEWGRERESPPTCLVQQQSCPASES
jgi:hypothetical protein